MYNSPGPLFYASIEYNRTGLYSEPESERIYYASSTANLHVDRLHSKYARFKQYFQPVCVMCQLLNIFNTKLVSLKLPLKLPL